MILRACERNRSALETLILQQTYNYAGKHDADAVDNTADDYDDGRRQKRQGWMYRYVIETKLTMMMVQVREDKVGRS